MSLDVAIIIGSETDLPVVEASKMFDVLDCCGINWEMSIISADRNPGILAGYLDKMREDGAKVFIGAAGMAARLPGAIAAHSKYLLPVIGAALPSDEFPNALDSLLSIVRSPAGCPVIFAGIGKAGLRNAAIIAIQILATGEDEASQNVKAKLVAYLTNNRKEPKLAVRKNSHIEARCGKAAVIQS